MHADIHIALTFSNANHGLGRHTISELGIVQILYAPYRVYFV